MNGRLLLVPLMLLGSAAIGDTNGDDRTATEIVRDALNHWRGTSSRGEMTMTIHRPDWERSMSMESWTQGEKRSLVRVTAPRKDRGNGTLMDDNKMWSFSPKVNRIIKIPSSMMSQSWMGSDFSNKDISKSTDIIDQYDHTLDAVEQLDGHTVYTITAVPHEEAAVVWGKEVLVIRDDFIMLEEQYWDQDDVLVKAMKTTSIRDMGGRSVAATMRMSKMDEPDDWTEITVDSIQFDIEFPANTFTLSNLRNPRR
jgi:outer membrane lipoprotein-sorting protein